MPVNDLAGSGTFGPLIAEQIYAGDGPRGTDAAPALADITKYQLLALTATGVTPFVVASHNAAQAVVAMQPALSGQQCPYIHTGILNHALIGWPAGTALDTYAERKAYMTGTLKVGKITAL